MLRRLSALADGRVARRGLASASRTKEPVPWYNQRRDLQLHVLLSGVCTYLAMRLVNQAHVAEDTEEALREQLHRAVELRETRRTAMNERVPELARQAGLRADGVVRLKALLLAVDEELQAEVKAAVRARPSPNRSRLIVPAYYTRAPTHARMPVESCRDAPALAEPEASQGAAADAQAIRAGNDAHAAACDVGGERGKEEAADLVRPHPADIPLCV